MASQKSPGFDLNKVIASAFAQDAATRHALQVSLLQHDCSSGERQPVLHYWSAKLHRALTAGAHVDHGLLRHVLQSRLQVDIQRICQLLSAKYGNDNTVRYWITDRTAGPYQQLLLALLCSA